MYQRTTATEKLLKLQKRLRVVAGGTSASKTISILMILIDYAQTHEGELISVVSETFPHLRRGAMRDFRDIMLEQGYWTDANWNKTESVYVFNRPDNNEWKPSSIEFFSAEESSKVRGPRRDILFINECNNISHETYEQLEIRTKKTIWLDFNPVSEFWYYTDIANKVDHDFITLTYKDNEGLDPAIVASIESKKDKKLFWQVYGLGQLGEAEGRIYTGWNFMDELPHEARLERRGLDFGYTNDPTAIVDIYSYNGGYILDEQLYQKGLSNKQIADVINNLEKTLTIADSSEPKSIDEISTYGVSILPSQKGQGSVNQGIQYVQNQKISVTKRSVNLIKEYRNYLWMTDKDGIVINTPADIWNHALDAVRYGMESLKPKDQEVVNRLSSQNRYNASKWAVVG